MKFSGTTDSETLHLYNSLNQQLIDEGNYIWHTSASTDFNLYQPCVKWQQSYTSGHIESYDIHDEFNDSPIHRFNVGLRLGAAYEVAGLQFGLSYTLMVSNMANKGYWDNKRFAVLNESKTMMEGYKHQIHTLEFRIAYTLRYI